MEKLTKKLEGLESQQTTMKAVNAYFRKHKTLDGCPELTPEQAESSKQIGAVMALGQKQAIPRLSAFHNNANIRRVRQRIEELSSRSELLAGHSPEVRQKSTRLKIVCSLFSRKSPMPISGRN